LYSPEEIEALSARARRIASGHDDTFVITNNHFEGKAVANALELTAALRGTRLATPEPLLSRYPRLAAIALPQSQRELF
jgi:uncharacterized protein YecE (DUF72 family)